MERICCCSLNQRSRAVKQRGLVFMQLHMQLSSMSPLTRLQTLNIQWQSSGLLSMVYSATQPLCRSVCTHPEVLSRAEGINKGRATAELCGTGTTSWGPARSPTSHSQKPHKPFAASMKGGPQRHALVSALRPCAPRARTVGKSAACSSRSRRHKSLGDN